MKTEITSLLAATAVALTFAACDGGAPAPAEKKAEAPAAEKKADANSKITSSMNSTADAIFPQSTLDKVLFLRVSFE